MAAPECTAGPPFAGSGDRPMGLADLFVAYLEQPDATRAGALAEQLRGTGLALEALALAAVAGGTSRSWATIEEGPWAGRRGWIGPVPPPDAQAGDLWLDTV